MKSALAALLLCVPLSTVAAQVQTGSVDQIKISSKWMGWGGSNSEIVISRIASGYLANGAAVQESLIANLLAAIDAPAVMKPGLTKIGITHDWLNVTADAALAAYAGNIPVAPTQREFFLSSFKDLKNIKRIVSNRFDGFWTDDYPDITITLTKTDGSVITVSSRAQHIFMLPWKVTRDGTELTTYNADISRAVASLMPEGFTNKKRLTNICHHPSLRLIAAADCRLDLQVAVWVVEEQAALWETLGAENKAKPYLDQLRRNFTILTAVMEPDRNGHYPRWMSDDTPMEPHLVVTLTQPGFPVRIEALLPSQSGKVENVDDLLASTERCRSVMHSASWLKPYLSDNTKLRFYLRFNRERYFQKRMMEKFSTDMERDQALVNAVKAAQKDACLLRVSGHKAHDDWLALPNGRMVLWRFSGDAPLLRWSSSDVVSSPCRSDTYLSRCAGAVISPDGKFLPN